MNAISRVLSASNSNEDTTVEKQREIMIESLDRTYRNKCVINLIGGVRQKIGPLARVMESNS